MGKRSKPVPPDTVPSLISNFLASSDRNGELDLLLPYTADPRVLELLVRVVGDPSEDVNARCKVMVHFSRSAAEPTTSEPSRRMLAALTDLATRKVGPDTDDGEVREWAIRGLQSFAAERAVAEALTVILFDTAESRFFRRAAFDALAGSAPWPERKPLFETLTTDEVMGEQAQQLIRVRRFLEQPRPPAQQQAGSSAPPDPAGG